MGWKGESIRRIASPVNVKEKREERKRRPLIFFKPLFHELILDETHRMPEREKRMACER